MSDSRPSLTISGARCGLYVMSGGTTAAIDADSTITAGCGLPPLSFAGTYGTNRLLVDSESSVSLSAVVGSGLAIGPLSVEALIETVGFGVIGGSGGAASLCVTVGTRAPFLASVRISSSVAAP